MTKQRRGSSMVRYSENSAQRWQSKHDILSFTVIWESCCFPQAWARMSLPYLHSFLLGSPHFYFQHKEIWLKIEKEGKYTKKAQKTTLNYPGGCAGSISACWDQGRKPLSAHGVSCCPVPSHLQDYSPTPGWGAGRSWSSPSEGCSRSHQTSLTPPTLDGHAG